jgi:hypothetical protein
MSEPAVNKVSSSRKVLDGVPRVHFFEGGEQCPEDYTFPSVMRALMEYLGENFGCKHCGRCDPKWEFDCTYSYFIIASGMASFLSWKPGFHMDNIAPDNMSADHEAPYRRAFEAAGYAYEHVLKEEGRDNENYFRQRIVESINQDRPVISFGVIGPPECGIISGYDENGEVITGWNFFQNDPMMAAGIELEPSGYFRKRDWYKDTPGLLVIGEKKDRLALHEIYHKALRWSLEVTRVPAVDDRHNGLAAYTAWADALACDEDFPADNEILLREHFDVHNNMVGTVAELRWYGSVGLTQMIERLHFNRTESLLKASGCYAGEHELMWEAWDLAGGNGNPEAYKKLADPEIRRKIALVILKSREKYAEAAEHIERALAKPGPGGAV